MALGKKKIRQEELFVATADLRKDLGHSFYTKLNTVLAEAGFDADAAIPNRDKLESYHLLYAVLGELEFRRRDPLTAAGWFRRAGQLTELKSEKDFLNRRYQVCVTKLEP